ncbi:hypothetical protein Q8F55_004964 [Vanrija albida]|uniref:Golgi apparatus membrane protein TVP38 n=1 Tax=Vanrija albida TaxID=181172 RepID=A0ABR3Q0B2_9TREE
MVFKFTSYGAVGPTPALLHSDPRLFADDDSSVYPCDSSIASDTESEDERELTAAERVEYERGLLTWDRARDWRFWVRWEWLGWYVLLGLIVLGVALVAVFHQAIVRTLLPFAQRLRALKAGWLIPLATIVLLSFPPLFGNDIVLILCGVVWGIKGGFAIGAAGTLLGELGAFTMFRTVLRNKARRFARRSLNYACLARVVDEGGVFVAWVVRMSVIPTHMSTVWQFFVALVLSLPKQFIAVYAAPVPVGYVVMNKNSRPESKIISDVVLVLTICVALFAVWFVHRQMLRVRKRVFLELREDLRRKGIREPPPPDDSGFVAAR